MAREPRDNRIPIMMSHEELAAVDDWRFANRVATRSDAVRRLCQMALGTGSIIADGALPQADSLLTVVQQSLANFTELDRDIRQGKYEDTATPANILDDVCTDLLEIIDHGLWLHSQLLQATSVIDELSRGPSVKTAQIRSRRTAETLEQYRKEIEDRRRESWENMLLGVILNELSASERLSLDSMNDDEADAFLEDKKLRLSARLKALEKPVGERIFDNARGRPDQLFTVALEGEKGA